MMNVQSGYRAPRRTSWKWRRYLVPICLYCLTSCACSFFGIGPGFYAFLIRLCEVLGGVPRYFAAGFSNYVTAFTDFRFGFTMGNILKFLVISVPLVIAMVVLLALLLHMRPGRAFIHAAHPVFHPCGDNRAGVDVAGHLHVHPQISPFGPILRAAGMRTLTRYFSRHPAFDLHHYRILRRCRPMDCHPVWRVEGISHEVVEAATIDGCSAWQKTLHVKLPLIRPYINYQLILILAGNVQLFVEPQLLGTTWVNANVPAQWSPNQLAYAFAFGLGNFGAASALSLLMLLIGLGAAYVVIRWTGFLILNPEYPGHIGTGRNALCLK